MPICLVGVGEGHIVPGRGLNQPRSRCRPSDTPKTERIGLMTRRSEVQILPPPPKKDQVRALPTGRALLQPARHPY